MKPLTTRSLPLKLGWFKTYHLAAGPYSKKPRIAMGVKLAKEIDKPAWIKLDAPDFGLFDADACLAVAAETLHLLVNNVPVYVGCLGGIGRTGTFLAVLAKAAGAKDPVGYVREHYLRHAVETPAQERFVEELDVAPLSRMLRRWRWESLLGPLARRRVSWSS